MKRILLVVMAFFTLLSVKAVNVTFRVDMANEVVSENGVFITGTMDGWSLSREMTRVDGTDYFETTYQLDANSGHRFKFFNGNGWDDVEDIPVEYNVGNDRIILIGEEDETIEYTFSGAPVTEHIPYVFNVDMSSQTVQDVRMVGNFNSWDPGNCIMTQLNGTDVFTRTLFLPPGRVISYKFINGDITGNQWDGIEELEGMECVNEDNNRELLLPGNEYSVTHVFNSCDSPTSLINSPAPDIHVYPNPFVESVYIEGINSLRKIEVLNLSGIVMGSYNDAINGVDLGYLSSGVYWLRIHSATEIVVVPILKK